MSKAIIITILFVTCLVGIMVISMIFSYLANKYEKLMIEASKKSHINNNPYSRDKKYSRPTDEMLSRDKKKERQEEIDIARGLRKYNPGIDPDAPQSEHEETTINQKEEIKIVGVVKPQGFWSEFVIKQKIGFMIAMGGLNKDQKSNTYWRNYIKAQAASESKEQSRGR